MDVVVTQNQLFWAVAMPLWTIALYLFIISIKLGQLNALLETAIP